MDAGDIDAAIARFEAALARYPNKMQLIYDYPDALIAAKRTRDAVAFLERSSCASPTTAACTAPRPKPTPSSATGCSSTSTRASTTRGRATCAARSTQLELAIKAGDGDFYQVSVVETRLRALRRELLEQQREQTTRNG